MEDNHTLTKHSNLDALRILFISRSITPGNNAATFAQWIYEARDALIGHSVGVVRNWITRSLRDTPAGTAKSLKHVTSVKLETLHGTVAPFDVIMRRLFNIMQGMAESAVLLPG